MSRSQRAKGFSLVELMVASAIVLVVFAGASMAAVQLHRRGTFEEAVADLQDVARGARELMAPRIERAGAGLSNLTVTVGTTGGRPDARTTIAVRTGVVAAPPPYAGTDSDSLDLYWGDGSLMTLTDCGAGSPRNGNDICVRRLPRRAPGAVVTIAAGDFVLVANANPNIASSCLFQVQGVITGATPERVQLAPALFADNAPAPSPCANGGATFWTSPDVYAVKAGGASFQVDWTAPSGTPRLQYDPDGRWDPRTGWLNVADNVERMQVRIGLLSRDQLNSNVVPLAPPPVIWFPDRAPAPARPSLDSCMAANPLCMLGLGNVDPNFRDTTDVVDVQIQNVLGAVATADDVLRAQLMRRARLVELDLTVRSARQDIAQIRRLGPGFVLDGAGNPMDGRNRRHYEMRVSLRNYGYSGI